MTKEIPLVKVRMFTGINISYHGQKIQAASGDTIKVPKPKADELIATGQAKLAQASTTHRTKKTPKKAKAPTKEEPEQE